MGRRDGMDSWDKGPWRWDGWGHPRQSRWDVGMGWTVGFKAPVGGMVGDIPGSPIQSRWDVGMGWTVGIKAPGGGMVGDIPGSPIQSRWDVGMGWTVGIKAPGGGMVGEIPGSPIQSRWDVGMGWTVGIKAPGGGMVGDSPGCPIQSRWDVGNGMVWHSPLLSSLHEGMWDSQNPMGLSVAILDIIPPPPQKHSKWLSLCPWWDSIINQTLPRADEVAKKCTDTTK